VWVADARDEDAGDAVFTRGVVSDEPPYEARGDLGSQCGKEYSRGVVSQASASKRARFANLEGKPSCDRRCATAPGGHPLT